MQSKNLRFDFSHYEKISDIQLSKIEFFVNSKIDDQISLIENREVPIQDAIDNGAIALFGEKYEDVVNQKVLLPQVSEELKQSLVVQLKIIINNQLINLRK